jgi:general secretion pathway protein H
MPTSVTGWVNNDSAWHRNRGFTLVEVMVVMVLISIIITFAVLSVDTGPEELRREGDRLASLLDLAAEDAVLNGREYRVILQPHGYSFEEYRDFKWQPSGDELLHPRQLPDNMKLEFSLENEPVDLANGGKGASLQLLSSGEIPSFKLVVSSENVGRFSIRGVEGKIVSNPSGDDDLS